MTTTETAKPRPNLAVYLADAPLRGFTVVQQDPTRYLLADAYGDGSTDELVTVHPGDFYTVSQTTHAPTGQAARVVASVAKSANFEFRYDAHDFYTVNGELVAVVR